MKLKEAIQLFEQYDSLVSYIDNTNDLPTRLNQYIDIEFDGDYEAFIDAVEYFEKRDPSKADEILDRALNNPSKLNILLNHINQHTEPSERIESIPMYKARNSGSYLVESRTGLIDDRGNPPAYLFRIVAQGELDSIKENGYISPSEFYGRIHASYEPDTRYTVAGSSLIAIEYDPRDEWKSKLSSDEVYAVTWNKVDISKVYIVR